MKASEVADIIADMLEAEKDVFMQMLKDEDWDAIRDEAYEYLTQE